MRRVLWLIVMVGGCGGGSGSSVPANQLAEEFQGSVCEWLTRCQAFSDVPTCKTMTFINPDRQIAGIGAGRVRYDGAQAADCVAEVRGLDCAAASFINVFQGATCKDVFVGLVATGQSCIVSDDCQDDGMCTGRMAGCDPEEMCCPGTCTAGSAPVAIGQSCGFTSTCVAGGFCDFNGTTGTCKAASAAAGTACEGDFACVAPLRCLADSAAGRTCQQPVASGGACDPAVRSICALIYEVCDPTERRCKTAPGLGRPCTDSCLGQASCENTVCVALPGPGQSCANTNCAGDLDCGPGELCVRPAMPVVCP